MTSNRELNSRRTEGQLDGGRGVLPQHDKPIGKRNSDYNRDYSVIDDKDDDDDDYALFTGTIVQIERSRFVCTCRRPPARWDHVI